MAWDCANGEHGARHLPEVILQIPPRTFDLQRVQLLLKADDVQRRQLHRRLACRAQTARQGHEIVEFPIADLAHPDIRERIGQLEQRQFTQIDHPITESQDRARRVDLLRELRQVSERRAQPAVEALDIRRSEHRTGLGEPIRRLLPEHLERDVAPRRGGQRRIRSLALALALVFLALARLRLSPTLQLVLLALARFDLGLQIGLLPAFEPARELVEFGQQELARLINRCRAQHHRLVRPGRALERRRNAAQLAQRFGHLACVLVSIVGFLGQRARQNTVELLRNHAVQLRDAAMRLDHDPPHQLEHRDIAQRPRTACDAPASRTAPRRAKIRRSADPPAGRALARATCTSATLAQPRSGSSTKKARRPRRNR